ncbi:hypothetical protein [Microscilla marina]|uniref:Uncharacterized protein n=1 Tax=Microscilla marina ATCC 23134 TaxID=313606 RepID=A1ZHR0_MICM2|nr:hypothetical protein [Microscilla marina]EAY30067.1 hypothetical protein M23134_05400 [Microscilla marina ATCC 23134]
MNFNFEDLATHYLHNEQLIKYDQIIQLLNNEEKFTRKSLQKSYKIFVKALQNLQNYLENTQEYYTSGNNCRGGYWEITYDIFATLNRECPNEMKIIYSARSEEFSKNHVRIYWEGTQTLPESLIVEFKNWA